MTFQLYNFLDCAMKFSWFTFVRFAVTCLKYFYIDVIFRLICLNDVNLFISLLEIEYNMTNQTSISSIDSINFSDLQSMCIY